MRRSIGVGSAALALLLLTAAPAAAKPGGENPVGTCSDSYVAMTIGQFAEAFPDEWAVRSERIQALWDFMDKNGNGMLCVKERPETSTTWEQFVQANVVEDSKKSGKLR